MSRFTSSEVATILVSLRLFQELFAHGDTQETRDSIVANFPEHFEGVEPLTFTEINKLCKEINGGQ